MLRRRLSRRPKVDPTAMGAAKQTTGGGDQLAWRLRSSDATNSSSPADCAVTVAASPSPRSFVGIAAFVAENEEELSFEANEALTTTSYVNAPAGWLHVQNQKGEAGLVPESWVQEGTIVQPPSAPSPHITHSNKKDETGVVLESSVQKGTSVQPPSPHTTHPSGGQTLVGVVSFTAANDEELSFEAHEVLTTTQETAPAGWIHVENEQGKDGLVPEFWVQKGNAVQPPPSSVKKGLVPESRVQTQPSMATPGTILPGELALLVTPTPPSSAVVAPPLAHSPADSPQAAPPSAAPPLVAPLPAVPALAAVPLAAPVAAAGDKKHAMLPQMHAGSDLSQNLLERASSYGKQVVFLLLCCRRR